MTSPRHRNALLLTVVVVGGLLRFAAVGFGLPRRDLGQDEMITATRVRDGVLVGHPGWPRFHWPNLNVHVSRGVVAAVRWLEKAAGLEAHDDVLIGRIYTAALGTLTLLLLYLAASRLFDPLVGIAAAGFLAAIPLHAFRSRLWVPDVPMTFYYTLALLIAVHILARPTYTRFVLAALAIGLATASKYNGAGACLAVGVAAVLALPGMGERWRLAAMANRLALAAALSVAVFFAADVFALARFDEVLEGMGFLAGLYVDVPSSGLLGWRIWTYILGSFFAGGYEGVGPLISILALAGWLRLLARPDRNGLFAWLPGLLYLLVLSSVMHDPYERVFLPLTPHIAMLAAVALVAAARRLAASPARWARPVALAGAGAVVLAALLPVTGQVVAARRDDTRLRAARWLDDNVPVGAFVFREWDMVLPTARHYDFNRRVLGLWEGRWTPELVARRMDFVVVTSTNFRRVRRQRRRAEFARPAGFYDQLIEGPLFALAAGFEPGLDAAGPEVRIYRSLLSRGPVLGPKKSGVDLLRQLPWVSNQRLRSQHHLGFDLRLVAAGDAVAGQLRVRPAGRYALEVSLASPAAAPVELRLGDGLRRARVEGEASLALEAYLPTGKSWWHVRAGPGFAGGEELALRGARLVRRPRVAPPQPPG